MRRFICIMIMIVFASTAMISYADTSTALSYDDVSKRMIEKSISVMKQENAIETLENQLNDVQGSAMGINKLFRMEKRYKELKRMGDDRSPLQERLYHIYKAVVGSMTDEKRMDLIKASKFSTLELEQSLKAMNNGLLIAQNATKLSAANQLISLRKLIITKELLAYKARRALSDYETAKKQFELGKLTVDQLKTYEVAWKKADFEQLKQDRAIKTAKMQLNRALGQEVKTEIGNNISMDFIKVPEELKSLDTYLTNALKNRSETKDAENNKIVKEEEYRLVRTVYGWEEDLDYANSKHEYDNALEQLETAKIQVESNIKTGYTNLLAAKNNWQYAEDSLEVSKKKYDEALSNNKVGKITASQLDKAYITWQQAIIQEESSKMDFWLVWYMMEMASDVGPGMSTTTVTGGVR